jgi:hypothetical protein
MLISLIATILVMGLKLAMNIINCHKVVCIAHQNYSIAEEEATRLVTASLNIACLV